MEVTNTTIIPLEFTFWYKVTFPCGVGLIPTHLPTLFPRGLTERIRKKKKMRKTHGSRKRQLSTGEKKLKTTHYSHKQTCAQTTSEQCLLWNTPPLEHASPVLLPNIAITVQKSSFILCQLPWLCPCLNFHPPLNKWLQGMESTGCISLKFHYLKHHWRHSLDFQLGVNFEVCLNALVIEGISVINFFTAKIKGRRE